jgi:hypothetical protein
MDPDPNLSPLWPPHLFIAEKTYQEYENIDCEQLYLPYVKMFVRQYCKYALIYFFIFLFYSWRPGINILQSFIKNSLRFVSIRKKRIVALLVVLLIFFTTSHPLQDATKLEFYSQKLDASLFAFGNHSKKRQGKQICLFPLQKWSLVFSLVSFCKSDPVAVKSVKKFCCSYLYHLLIAFQM